MTNREHKSASKRPARSTDQHWPFGYLLRPLAADRGAQAIGTGLSSTASDGVLGLKAIKGVSGITLARHPLAARYDGMLRSAIAAGNLEATQVNSHLTDLLASVDLPILMLGENLPSRHFTPQAQPLLNLFARDVGRPITDIRPNIHRCHPPEERPEAGAAFNQGWPQAGCLVARFVTGRSHQGTGRHRNHGTGDH